MAQHDYVIDNSTGANVRADINNVLQAIATNNSGSSAPSTTVATQFFADTSAGIMKLRNTANSGYVNLFTLAGGIDVDAASNFNEDVTFTTSNGNNLLFDKSDNALEFGDGVKALFGASSDLEIQHTGTHSVIKDTGTGNLQIAGSLVQITNAGITESGLIFTENDSVVLKFDNSTKFETTSTGTTITGDLFLDNPDHAGKDLLFDSSAKTLKFDDGVAAKFGTGTDLSIYHNGSTSFIQQGGTGQLIIQGNDNDQVKIMKGSSEEGIILNNNGDVQLYHDNAQKFATKSYGAAVTGNFVTTGAITIESGNDLFLADSGKIQLGTGNDFEVYHNGTDGIIDNNTGNLSIQTTANLELVIQSILQVKTKGGTENCIIGTTDGAVELYFDNTERFATKSDGALLSGKYRQKSSGGNIVYAQQVFRESIAANTTKTFTITGMAYGNVKLTMGFGDGNFHYAAFAAVLGGNMYSVGNAYAAAQLLNDRSGVNSITVTKSNSSYAVAIHAGTNQIFGSVVVESNGYDTHSGVTLTIS